MSAEIRRLLEHALEEFAAYEADRRRTSYRPHSAVARAKAYVDAALLAAPAPQPQENKEDTRVDPSAVAPDLGDLPRKSQPDSSPRWHPIETSPQDGTEVLVWCIGQCEIEPSYNIASYGEAKDWTGWTSIDGFETRPTHWMPLPQAPGAVSDKVFAVDPIAPERPQEAIRAHHLDSSTLPPLAAPAQEDEPPDTRTEPRA